jgi:hypothetical protein
MTKKVWISFPLITTSDLKDESVVAFLKGGQKKDLEVEVAAFVTKWLMDKDVPFWLDFESCGVDRAVVIESLPKRLQKILGASAPVIAGTAVADPGEVAQVEPESTEVVEVGAADQVGEAEVVDQVEGPAAVEDVAEVEAVGADIPRMD